MTILTLLVLSHRPFINGKVEEKTAGDGPSLATMFEDDRHLQGIIQNIKVCGITEIWLPLPTPSCNVVFPFELPVDKRKQTNTLNLSGREGCGLFYSPKLPHWKTISL